jgi:hypothetical protein
MNYQPLLPTLLGWPYEECFQNVSSRDKGKSKMGEEVTILRGGFLQPLCGILEVLMIS